MLLSMTAAIGLKIFKLLAVLLEHLISQLSLSMSTALCTTFVFNLVSKLILEFFFSNKVFWSKTHKYVCSLTFLINENQKVTFLFPWFSLTTSLFIART